MNGQMNGWMNKQVQWCMDELIDNSVGRGGSLVYSSPFARSVVGS